MILTKAGRVSLFLYSFVIILWQIPDADDKHNYFYQKNTSVTPFVGGVTTYILMHILDISRKGGAFLYPTVPTKTQRRWSMRDFLFKNGCVLH